MNDLHALASFKALDEGRLQPVDKAVVALAQQIAEVQNPRLFSASIDLAHRAASPYTIEVARAKAVSDAKLLLCDLSDIGMKVVPNDEAHQSETGAALTRDGREAVEERARAIVKAYYPEMPASYRGRRYQVALAALTEAADEIASLRARVEVMRETCARIAERDADRSNAVFEAGIGGDAGKDRNDARYRTARRIARAIRDTPVE